MSKLKCEDCGTERGVEKTQCPFAEEIHGEKIEAVLCGDCYQNRCEDI